jgi:hypothetical protein
MLPPIAVFAKDIASFGRLPRSYSTVDTRHPMRREGGWTADRGGKFTARQGGGGLWTVTFEAERDPGSRADELREVVGRNLSTVDALRLMIEKEARAMVLMGAIRRTEDYPEYVRRQKGAGPVGAGELTLLLVDIAARREKTAGAVIEGNVIRPDFGGRKGP